MAEMKDIVKVAVDAYHGNVEQYSVGQSMELLHKALIDANGGSTTLNYKNIRDGKCSGLFTLIEEVLSRTVVEGLQGDEYSMLWLISAMLPKATRTFSRLKTAISLSCLKLQMVRRAFAVSV